jgi:hypothetical protein
VFVVGLRICAGVVDDAIPMIRRRIERIKLQRNTSGVDDVVFGPGRHDYRETHAYRGPNPIDDRLTTPLFNAKELVELVDFRPDLFLGLLWFASRRVRTSNYLRLRRCVQPSNRPA